MLLRKAADECSRGSCFSEKTACDAMKYNE